ncbi:D-serine deaminase-like pyridoxal phosphate-dependent protein [Arthrobacter sp. PvP102]|uniref:alanine racemase n=1 Tax=unclassified Arthrobacter TaxID=235627 RepID=UPI001AE69D2F|nr:MULTISPECIES: alanine racemase [unclassified Arthrobacter]MBP1235482.1 D-serine deaminase-like pyridoxal phosphate-dependent protein [Arthrobacter sp. PvP103]MBP1236441.1 D-serine deaminase-like pyridoxal phosphate-dependent protein [Arthrobacter sp. PvP102]
MPYPQLRLNADALENNIRVMASWCRERQVDLAPHVKTTMSAPIISRQMAAGAVGVTVATVDQVASALGWGHRHVLIANEVVDRYGLARIRGWLGEDSGREIRCFVDSDAGVNAAAEVFGAEGVALEVLIDVGTPGGRTGVRSLQEAVKLAGLVHAAPGLRLVGVAGYEGVVPNSRAEGTVAAVDRHCRLVRDVYLEVAPWFETSAPVYSMGGSAFPDRVAEYLPDGGQVPGTRRVLRSGCYVTHDHGTYAGVSPVPGLAPALTVRAVVLSTPEDGIAVVGAGKRDLPYDAGLPVVLSVHTADGTPRAGAAAVVRNLFDHHTVLTGVNGLEVTDVVDFGISHPCSAFDRWPEYVVTDGTGRDVDVWHTDFHRSSLVAPKR